MSVVPGSRVGPYRVLARLGAGGMGEVYRAQDTKLGRDVALKFLPDAFAQDVERLARFRREAHVLARLNHPNIAGTHGLEDTEGVPVLVMELVEGPTLAEVIASGYPESQSGGRSVRRGPPPRGLKIGDALAIARQIAEALAHSDSVTRRWKSNPHSG